MGVVGALVALVVGGGGGAVGGVLRRGELGGLVVLAVGVLVVVVGEELALRVLRLMPNLLRRPCPAMFWMKTTTPASPSVFCMLELMNWKFRNWMESMV